jgi:hypothetical protein
MFEFDPGDYLRRQHDRSTRCGGNMKALAREERRRSAGWGFLVSLMASLSVV